LVNAWRLPVSDKDHCVGLWDRVLIQVWHYKTTARAIAELTLVARKFTVEAQAPISSLAIIERTSPPPHDQDRKLLANFYREFAPTMAMQIVVADGGGFRAALVRAVGVTLSTLAPRALPFKFVGDVTDASALLAAHLSPKGDRATLERVIEGVREQSRQVAADSRRSSTL
jgi:hypothetical protein